MLISLEYFYDRQMLRFLEQLVRAFSGYQYMSGSINGQPPSLKIVPCHLAQNNSAVANIMRNQSTNTLLTTPMITIAQNGLRPRNEDLQNRAHVDTRQVVERAIDEQTGKYTGARGNSYTVRRLMPLPYNMMVQVDIWTSNQGQKYQLAEQILTYMGPSFDIQNSENALDWSALTTCYVEDVNWSSRQVPVGTSDEIDVMTINLRLPIWLTPPAKITQQTIIQQVVANVNDEAPLPGVISDEGAQQGARLAQSIVTPEDAHVRVRGNIITLLGADGEDETGGVTYPWIDLLNLYGTLRPAASQLLLYTTADIEGPAIIGTLQATQTANEIYWQIDPDTLPMNTLLPVTAVIEPLKTSPVDGLGPPAEGQRYLILADIGPSVAWGQINAKYGDIIQYKNGAWVVDFHAAGSGEQFVINLHSGTQLKWNGDDWIFAIDGTYAPGYWRLRL